MTEPNVNRDRAAQDAEPDKDPPVKIDIGHDEIIISNRYESLSIINDILIGIFFFVGSVLFYFKPLEFWAITFFVLGSIDFLLRPVIRLARRFHLQRIGMRQGDNASQYY
ncbi:YrhK family protein [Arthrobacter castelli]|uniref:YrhK family protein n=1 Tax=Arthrobacter castelli TaxID=271431 RepID=UPI000412A9B1|nr:YrhK family protein [Arthrobacter castelli]